MVKIWHKTKDDLKLLADELHTEIQEVYDEVEVLHRDFNTMEIMTAKNAFSKNPFGFSKGVFLCVTFFGKR